MVVPGFVIVVSCVAIVVISSVPLLYVTVTIFVTMVPCGIPDVTFTVTMMFLVWLAFMFSVQLSVCPLMLVGVMSAVW